MAHIPHEPEHDTRWLNRTIDDAHRCARWNWNAALRSARRALEFDAELAEPTAHIPNPLQMPLENMTAERNFWRASFWVVVTGVMINEIAKNAMWWLGGAR